MTRMFALAAVLAGTFAAAATADTAVLDQPMAGQTLHDGSVDMSVYWTRAGSAHEVVALYLPKSSQGAPLRLIMALEEGDKTSFKLPGQADVTYVFERRGDVTTVTAASRMVQLAAN